MVYTRMELILINFFQFLLRFTLKLIIDGALQWKMPNVLLMLKRQPNT